MNRVKIALIACATLALGMAISAALIGVSGYVVSNNVPRTSFVGPSNVLGALSYSAGSRNLTLDVNDAGGGGFSSRFIVGQPLKPHFPAPVSNTMLISMRVLTNDGMTYVGNGAPNDFIMQGSADINYNGVIDPGESGTLLTGSLLQFGFNNLAASASNPAGTPDNLDFRFAVTGGILAPRYAGKDIGVREIIEADSWNNNNVGGTEFMNSFQGSAKGDIVPIPCGSSIGDFVWNDLNRNGIQDPGEPGLNGITVRLRDNTNALLATMVTGNGGVGNQPGYYNFPGLCLGTYTVEVDASTALPFIPTSTGAGTPSTDSNVNPSTSAIVTGNYVTGDQTIDFGFKTPCTGVIGDFVWHDLNRDGLQDFGEPGMQGVKIRLLTAGGAEITTTTTNAAGNYSFGGLCAGSYRVDVDLSTLPAGFTPSPTNVGPDPTIDSQVPQQDLITLANDTATNTTIDFGYLGLCEGMVGDYVWFDLNHDGIQDANEVGIDGLPVTLNGPGGTRNTTTGVNPNDNTKHGYYQFTGLCTGAYTVDVQVPAGFTPSPQFAGGNTALDSNGPVNGGPATVSLPNDLAQDQTIDFGFLSCPGVIGDFVWQDTNLNGIQDMGELGYPGITVNLRRTSDNAIIQSATTGGDGLYSFQGLCPGSYKIQVDPPALAAVSPTNQGGNPALDSNVNPSTVTLTFANQTDSTVDFGFLPTGSIGDRVWNDNDGDGVQDGGEPGLVGWTVNIFGPYGYMNAQVTGADGIYTFSNLPAGSYVVCVNTMMGYAQTYDLDGLGTPSCATRAILEGVHATDVDFGYRRPSSIGDRVWNDIDGDGVQDGGEPGISGWQVNITGPNAFASSHITGANGFYMFTNLEPGTYTVCVVPQPGYNQTYDLDGLGTPNCANRTVVAGENATDVDFGYRQAPVDLVVIKSDGVASYTPGSQVVYTIQVGNFGPGDGTGSLFSDNKPAQISSWTWTCLAPTGSATGCDPSGGPITTNFTDTINLPVGGVINYQVTATIANNAVGNLVNTGTVTPPPGTPNSGNNCPNYGGGVFDPQTGSCSSTDTDTPPTQVDLFVSKTDGVTSVNAGGTTVYTVTVNNNGPASANNSVLTDPLATGLTKTSLGACTAAGGAVCPAAGSGAGQLSIANLESAGGVIIPTLPSGGSIAFTITATVAGNVTSVTNTATVTPPNGTPNTGIGCVPSNGIIRTFSNPTCSSPDTDTVTPVVNLFVSKTDGVTTVNAGANTVYTVTVNNSGPSSADLSVLKDPVAADLTKSSLGACTAAGGAVCPAAGSGAGQLSIANLESAGGVIIPTLPSGGSISFTITAAVAGTATSVTNTATVTPPSGTTNTGVGCVPGGGIIRNFANPTCSSPDTDTVTPVVNLFVSKTDGVSGVSAGGSTVYTVTVNNSGPSSANNSVLKDPIATGLTKTALGACSAAGGAVCPAAGSGAGQLSIANLENAAGVIIPTLPSGGSITFTITAAVAGNVTSVTNTATVTPPGGTTNTGAGCVPGGGIIRNFTNPTCSSPDTDTVTPVVDLRISKTDGVTMVAPGGTTTYTVVVTNGGPSGVTNAIITDPAPAGILLGNWTCAVSAVGSGSPVVTACGAAAGSGPLSTTASLNVNGSVTYTIAATITAQSGSVTNTANVTPPGGTTNTGSTCASNGGVFNAATGTCSASDTDLVPSGTIGDFIWNDLNANGVQDGGAEVGIAFSGIPVTLYDSTGTIQLQTTNANANGFYLFTGLGAGSYIVRVPVTAGYDPSPALQGGNTSLDSNGTTVGAPAGFVQAAVTLATNSSNDLTIDFGFNSPGSDLGNGGFGKIGNFVWYDQNLNGIQDAGEPGIANVHIEIAGPNGFTGHVESDLNGFYQFVGLKSGSYTLTPEPPPGYVTTQVGKGSAATVCTGSGFVSDGGTGAAQCDSNPNPTIVVGPSSWDLPGPNNVDNSVDFGLTMGQDLCPPTGSAGPSNAGTLVWGLDASGNLYVRYSQNRGINDNSYGTNKIGWSTHTFSDLVSSDKAEFKITNMAGNVVLDFYSDYITATTKNAQFPSGYKSFGPTGGDGSMVTGNAAQVLSYDSSLAKNLNKFCTTSNNCVVSGLTLTTNSPVATPNDDSGQATGAFAGWDFVNSYEFVVKANTFGAGNLAFGGVSVATVHNSPAKAGSNQINPLICGPQLGACVLGYPYSSSVARTSTVFNENEVLAAFGLTRTATQDTVQLWANDEHAPILGARTSAQPAATISAMNGNPGHVSNPLVGDTTITDPFGRPMFPEIYITDVTGLSDNATHTDPAYRAGDWQYGGSPVRPDDIFGTWKGAVQAMAAGRPFTVDADPAKNNWILGPGSDTPVGGFGALKNEGYGTEARWNVGALTVNGQPLITGHSYRVQFIVHDGDQNKTGGDVGQACVILKKMAALPPATADLSVTKTDNVTTVTTGSSTTYAVTVSNAGTFAADGAILTDPAATGLNTTAVSCTSAAGGAACPAAANVTVALLQSSGIVIPALPAGGSVTFSVVATVTGSGTVTNTATIAPPSGVTDPTSSNNSASDSDTVVAPTADLSVTKTDGKTTVSPGSSTTYTVTVSNAGSFAANGAILTDPVATGLNKTAVTCTTAAGGAACPAAANVTVALLQSSGIVIPTLPSGGSVTFSVVATVTGSGTVTNTATIAPPAGLTDPTSSNNSASDSDTVIAELPKPVLTLTKAGSAASVKKNTNFTYTLTYKNSGTVAATSVVISDVLPAGTTFVSATNSGVNSSGTVTWNVGTVAAGAQSSVSVVVKWAATGSKSNTGTIKSTEITTPVSSNAVATTVN